MKTKLLIVILFLLGGLHSYAQEQKAYISMGVVGGFDMSSISTSDPVTADMSMRPGFNVGIAANIRFCKRNQISSAKTGLLAIQPEIRYATMGAKTKDSGISLGYLMVPVMLKVYPTKSFYLEAGPEFSMHISNSPSHFATESYQINMSDLQANDIMLGVGLGFSLRGFTIGARYNYGFSDLASNLPWKNSLIQLNIGYLFQKKQNAKSNKKMNVYL